MLIVGVVGRGGWRAVTGECITTVNRSGAGGEGYVFLVELQMDGGRCE